MVMIFGQKVEGQGHMITKWVGVN